MPPKRVTIEGPRGSRAPKGFLSATYETLTAAENQAVLRSVAVFGVAVAFFASPYADFLLPPV